MTATETTLDELLSTDPATVGPTEVRTYYILTLNEQEALNVAKVLGRNNSFDNPDRATFSVFNDLAEMLEARGFTPEDYR